MSNLRKTILSHNTEKILKKNSFVLFFQFNNIKVKEWILLKNEILNLPDTSTLIIKNKIFNKVFDCKNTSKLSPNVVSNFDITNTSSKQAFSLSFLSQGPTLLVGFKSVHQCEIICRIIDNFPHQQVNKNLFHNNNSTMFKHVNQSGDKFIETHKLPSIFTQTKKNLEKNENLSTQKNVSKLIFVGGLAQGKVINHLDLKKLLNLDSSVYTKLVHQCTNPVANFLFLKVLIEMKLLKSLEKKHNLLYVLIAYKNSLMKQKKLN